LDTCARRAEVSQPQSSGLVDRTLGRATGCETSNASCRPAVLCNQWSKTRSRWGLRIASLDVPSFLFFASCKVEDTCPGVIHPQNLITTGHRERRVSKSKPHGPGWSLPPSPVTLQPIRYSSGSLWPALQYRPGCACSRRRRGHHVRLMGNS